MIYTITMNPALDYIIETDHFEAGTINRIREEHLYAGGKGINVSMILRELGMDSTALGFAAGFTGKALTEALRAAFATENTNNTDESSLSRTMTEEHLWQLNETAQTWLYENISDSEAEELLMLKTFHFSDDAPGTERGMRTAKAAVYLLRGNDPETLHSRILLGNTEPCFYLFLRAYYSEAENRTRVYMINGLVW